MVTTTGSERREADLANQNGECHAGEEDDDTEDQRSDQSRKEGSGGHVAQAIRA